MKKIITYKNYHFGGMELRPVEMELLLSILEEPAPKTRTPILGGRTSIKTLSFRDKRLLIIKEYFRGGWLRHLNKKYYLRLGKTRSQLEFEALQLAREAGVNCPEPLAFVFCGKLFYRNWLLLRKINNSQTLSEIAITDPKRAQEIMPKLVIELQKLIDAKILHVDLHPGNVLLDEQNSVYLIDFDKARRVRLKEKILQKLYLNRWRRAIQKHKLPDLLAIKLNFGQ
jgi:3-deoxy-D-manno-octulosonic acid kinase